VGAAHRLPLGTPEELGELWRRAGLLEIDIGELAVAAHYGDFDDLWRPFAAGAGGSGAYCASLDRPTRNALRDEVCRRLGSPGGPFQLTARAWYARGLRPTDHEEGR
jgi:hypothetical protein